MNVGRSGLQFPEMHAGVNSGEVMVAPDAADGFAVVGDTVNTASRLGDLAEAGQILVDQTTKERTTAGIRYASQRRRRVKGKAEPLASYEALGLPTCGPGDASAGVRRPNRRPGAPRARVRVDRAGGALPRSS